MISLIYVYIYINKFTYIEVIKLQNTFTGILQLCVIQIENRVMQLVCNI